MIQGDSRMNAPGESARKEQPEHPAPRRPYVKPTFSCERIFDITATQLSGNAQRKRGR
jgi:hypothetical protein